MEEEVQDILNDGNIAPTNQENEQDVQICGIIDDVNKMCLEHPAHVNAILQKYEGDPCAICEGPHQTIDCEYISRSNVSPIIVRKANQWRLKLKDQIREKETKANMTRNPRPYNGTLPDGTKKVGFERPKVKTLSTEQAKAFNEEIEANEKVDYEIYNEQHTLTDQEIDNIHTIGESLQDLIGDDIDCSTPIVAFAKAGEREKIEENDDNFIPVHAEWEDPLIPSDYSAYNGALNW